MLLRIGVRRVDEARNWRRRGSSDVARIGVPPGSARPGTERPAQDWRSPGTSDASGPIEAAGVGVPRRSAIPGASEFGRSASPWSGRRRSRSRRHGPARLDLLNHDNANYIIRSESDPGREGTCLLIAMGISRATLSRARTFRGCAVCAAPHRRPAASVPPPAPDRSAPAGRNPAFPRHGRRNRDVA